MTDWTRATEIAHAVLLHLAQDPDLLGQLCAETGLSPADLRDTAGQPGFVGAMLDFIAADDRRLLDFAAEAGVAPDAVARLRAAVEAGIVRP
ncbi:DUF3572 family protein [Paracoccus luteus]|uniref:DUF3572 family protein n=1 Tax=Paracoccus luteus TaxID=2508543 RepID=UPI00106FDD16|nr:DUF3572 family protein [Paracoccus luteus]